MSWHAICAAFSCVAEQPRAGHTRTRAQLARSPWHMHCAPHFASLSHGWRAKCLLLACACACSCCSQMPPAFWLPGRYEKLVAVMEDYDVDHSGGRSAAPFFMAVRLALVHARCLPRRTLVWQHTEPADVPPHLPFWRAAICRVLRLRGNVSPPVHCPSLAPLHLPVLC